MERSICPLAGKVLGRYHQDYDGRIHNGRETVTRMGRELSLVLLGAGILTAGYFMAPSRDEELETKADELAAEEIGEDKEETHRRHRSHLPLLLFVHSRGYAGAGTGPTARASSPAVKQGGFGATGRAFGGARG